MGIRYADLYSHVEHNVRLFKDGDSYILSCVDCGMDLGVIEDAEIHCGHTLEIEDDVDDDRQVNVVCIDCDEIIAYVTSDSDSSEEDNSDYSDDMWDDL